MFGLYGQFLELVPRNLLSFSKIFFSYLWKQVFFSKLGFPHSLKSVLESGLTLFYVKKYHFAISNKTITSNIILLVKPWSMPLLAYYKFIELWTYKSRHYLFCIIRFYTKEQLKMNFFKFLISLRFILLSLL